MTEQISPCKQCGSKAVLHEELHDCMQTAYYYNIWCEGENDDGCLLHTVDYDTKEEAIAAWNRIPNPPEENSFRVIFDPSMTPEDIHVAVKALGDLYRACGGAGLEFTFAIEEEERPICTGCGSPIDPECCGCGSPMEDHDSWWHGHTAIPMGCNCMRNFQPQSERPKE